MKHKVTFGRRRAGARLTAADLIMDLVCFDPSINRRVKHEIRWVLESFRSRIVSVWRSAGNIVFFPVVKSMIMNCGVDGVISVVEYCVCVLCAGGVWAGSVQEDVGVETMGAAGGGASSQPVEMAHLNTPVYMLILCVCVCVRSIPLLLMKHCTNKSPAHISPFILKIDCWTCHCYMGPLRFYRRVWAKLNPNHWTTDWTKTFLPPQHSPVSQSEL